MENEDLLLENNDYEEYEDFNEEYEEEEEDDDSVDESDNSVSDEEEDLSENEEEEEEVIDGIDVETVENNSVSVSKTKTNNSIIRNKLTKYEYTRIFSSRVTHIQNGAIPMVKIDKDMTVEDIVKREFEQGRVPLIIERTLPKEKGTLKEYRRINEVFNVILH
jgi:DNA-directed RNA polymerase subunit K/omega